MATYTCHVSTDAAGDLVVDFRYDEPAGDQAFVVAWGDGRIEVSATTPGVISAYPAANP